MVITATVLLAQRHGKETLSSQERRVTNGDERYVFDKKG